jgi:DNA-binding transcriptional MerR regulator
MRRFQIGELAGKSGLNPKTIRYYESIGLLPRAMRTRAGYRLYTKETLETLRFIIKAKSLGLRLREIRQIIALHEKGELPCACTKELIEKKIRECDDKINSLADLKERLAGLLRPKEKQSPRSTICPIIEKAG